MPRKVPPATKEEDDEGHMLLEEALAEETRVQIFPYFTKRRVTRNSSLLKDRLIQEQGTPRTTETSSNLRVVRQKIKKEPTSHPKIEVNFGNYCLRPRHKENPASDTSERYSLRKRIKQEPADGETNWVNSVPTNELDDNKENLGLFLRNPMFSGAKKPSGRELSFAKEESNEDNSRAEHAEGRYSLRKRKRNVRKNDCGPVAAAHDFPLLKQIKTEDMDCVELGVSCEVNTSNHAKCKPPVRRSLRKSAKERCLTTGTYFLRQRIKVETTDEKLTKKVSKRYQTDLSHNSVPNSEQTSQILEDFAGKKSEVVQRLVEGKEVTATPKASFEEAVATDVKKYPNPLHTFVPNSELLIQENVDGNNARKLSDGLVDFSEVNEGTDVEPGVIFVAELHPKPVVVSLLDELDDESYTQEQNGKKVEDSVTVQVPDRVFSPVSNSNHANPVEVNNVLGEEPSEHSNLDTMENIFSENVSVAIETSPKHTSPPTGNPNNQCVSIVNTPVYSEKEAVTLVKTDESENMFSQIDTQIADMLLDDLGCNEICQIEFLDDLDDYFLRSTKVNRGEKDDTALVPSTPSLKTRSLVKIFDDWGHEYRQESYVSPFVAKSEKMISPSETERWDGFPCKEGLQMTDCNSTDEGNAKIGIIANLLRDSEDADAENLQAEDQILALSYLSHVSVIEEALSDATDAMLPSFAIVENDGRNSLDIAEVFESLSSFPTTGTFIPTETNAKDICESLAEVLNTPAFKVDDNFRDIPSAVAPLHHSKTPYPEECAELLPEAASTYFCGQDYEMPNKSLSWSLSGPSEVSRNFLVADLQATGDESWKEDKCQVNYTAPLDTPGPLPSFATAFSRSVQCIYEIEQEFLAAESSPLEPDEIQMVDTEGSDSIVITTIGELPPPPSPVSPIPEEIEKSFYWSPTTRYLDMTNYVKYFNLEKIVGSEDPEVEFFKQMGGCEAIDEAISGEYKERQRLGQVAPEPKWLLDFIENTRRLRNCENGRHRRRVPTKRSCSFQRSKGKPKRARTQKTRITKPPSSVSVLLSPEDCSYKPNQKKQRRKQAGGVPVNSKSSVQKLKTSTVAIVKGIVDELIDAAMSTNKMAIVVDDPVAAEQGPTAIPSVPFHCTGDPAGNKPVSSGDPCAGSTHLNKNASSVKSKADLRLQKVITWPKAEDELRNACRKLNRASWKRNLCTLIRSPSVQMACQNRTFKKHLMAVIGSIGKPRSRTLLFKKITNFRKILTLKARERRDTGDPPTLNQEREEDFSAVSLADTFQKALSANVSASCTAVEVESLWSSLASSALPDISAHERGVMDMLTYLSCVREMMTAVEAEGPKATVSQGGEDNGKVEEKLESPERIEDEILQTEEHSSVALQKVADVTPETLYLEGVEGNRLEVVEMRKESLMVNCHDLLVLSSWIRDEPAENLLLHALSAIPVTPEMLVGNAAVLATIALEQESLTKSVAGPAGVIWEHWCAVLKAGGGQLREKMTSVTLRVLLSQMRPENSEDAT